jgi:hypothetical protein
MFRFATYLQECPVCGRPLEVRTEYIGQRVQCQHCRGQWIARDPDRRSGAAAEGGNRLLWQAERLLEMSSRRLAFCPARDQFTASR